MQALYYFFICDILKSVRFNMAKKNEYNSINKNPLPSSSRNYSLFQKSSTNPVNNVSSQTTYKPNNYETRNKNIKKQTTDIMTAIKTFAIVCSTAVLGVTGTGLISTGPKIDAEIMELGYGDEGIFYFVTLSEYVDGITIELYNDFTNRVDKVEGTEVDGFFENLAPNMSYTFAVKYGNKTLAKQTIVTKYVDYYEDQYYEDIDWENYDEQNYPNDPDPEKPILSDDYPENEDDLEYEDDPDNPIQDDNGDIDPDNGYYG